MLNKAEQVKLRKLKYRIASWGSDEYSQTHRLVPEKEIQHVLAELGAMVGPTDEETEIVAQKILDGGGIDG